MCNYTSIINNPIKKNGAKFDENFVFNSLESSPSLSPPLQPRSEGVQLHAGLGSRSWTYCCSINASHNIYHSALIYTSTKVGGICFLEIQNTQSSLKTKAWHRQISGKWTTLRREGLHSEWRCSSTLWWAQRAHHAFSEYMLKKKT